MNKRTKALTTEQYKEIIQTMREGFCGCRPNERIATALVLEGNLGLRISDILSLRLSDIVRDGDSPANPTQKIPARRNSQKPLTR